MQCYYIYYYRRYYCSLPPLQKFARIQVAPLRGLEPFLSPSARSLQMLQRGIQALVRRQSASSRSHLRSLSTKPRMADTTTLGGAAATAPTAAADAAKFVCCDGDDCPVSSQIVSSLLHWRCIVGNDNALQTTIWTGTGPDLVHPRCPLRFPLGSEKVAAAPNARKLMHPSPLPFAVLLEREIVPPGCARGNGTSEGGCRGGHHALPLLVRGEQEVPVLRRVAQGGERAQPCGWERHHHLRALRSRG